MGFIKVKNGYFFKLHVKSWIRQSHSVIGGWLVAALNNNISVFISLAGAPQTAKSLYKLVSEHKDVLKIVSVLSSIISSSKIEAAKVLASCKEFEELWVEVSWLWYIQLFIIFTLLALPLLELITPQREYLLKKTTSILSSIM